MLSVKLDIELDLFFPRGLENFTVHIMECTVQKKLRFIKPTVVKIVISSSSSSLVVKLVNSNDIIEWSHFVVARCKETPHFLSAIQ